MKRTLLAVTFAASLAAGQTLACACTFQHLAIAPVTTENGETYHGAAGGVEVLFHNDVKDHAVTQFPEPPMTLRRSKPAAECVVDDGGVWGRDGVWISGDGRTLVTIEASGSSEDLVFRDTRTCAKVGTVDVAGMQWRAKGPALLLHARVGQGADRRVPLDAACRPAVPPKSAH
jgi:hypothetical protein